MDRSLDIPATRSGARLRPMIPADGEAFAALSRACPDTGLVRAAARYHIDPLRALEALRPDTMVLCADSASGVGLAAAACVSFGELRIDGSVRPHGLFHTLMVHPAERGRGLGSELTGQCTALARERLGPEGVILAHVQDGNVGSLRAIERHLRGRGGRLVGGAARMRRRPPPAWPERAVRRASPGDIELVAARLDEFYREHDLAPVRTAELLRRRLDSTPLDEPFRHGYVVADRAGNLLCGLTLVEQSRLRTLEVQSIPALMRIANRLLRVLPPDRILRQLVVEDAWFAPGHEASARYLWESIRWEWRAAGDAVICLFDPRSPARAALRLPRWLPQTSMTTLIDAPAPPRGGRPLYPMV